MIDILHRVAPRAIIIFIANQIKYFGEIKTHEKNVFEKITHQSFETPARPIGWYPRHLLVKEMHLKPLLAGKNSPPPKHQARLWIIIFLTTRASTGFFFHTTDVKVTYLFLHEWSPLAPSSLCLFASRNQKAEIDGGWKGGANFSYQICLFVSC